MKRISPQELATELDRITRALRALAPRQVILFGSCARGDYHAGSDVDLLIIQDTNRPFVERGAEVLRACRSELAIEPLVYTPHEFERMLGQKNPFILQAIAEGIVLYEQ